MAEDLGLSEDDVQANLNLSGVKVGETIGTAMTPAHAQPAFGKMPPDLSLIARVRGSDWIYTYLKSFYLDESRPVGWNNTLFPNVSMPNPLWEMQGVQHAVLTKPNAAGEQHVERLELRSPGTQSAEHFDQSVRDISAFLEYAGEPAAPQAPETRRVGDPVPCGIHVPRVFGQEGILEGREVMPRHPR